jgi:large subunit ribosomal protein L4
MLLKRALFWSIIEVKMELEVLDLKKKAVRKIEACILDVEHIRHDLIHQLITWQLAKKRSAIAHAKGISEVRGSTRKIYRQKGTGRARHGSIRGAQFRGGGIIFGPSNESVFTYKINKKVKKIALLNALALKLKNKSIIIHESFEIKDGKTKTFINMYGSKSSSNKMLFIDSDFSKDFINSTKNFPNVDRLCAAGVNVLDLIRCDEIHFSEQAFKSIVERLK